jgi:hypothetical protein
MHALMGKIRVGLVHLIRKIHNEESVVVLA